MAVFDVLQRHANHLENQLEEQKRIIKTINQVLGKEKIQSSVRLAMEQIISYCSESIIVLHNQHSLPELLERMEQEEHKTRLDYIDTKNLMRHHTKNNPEVTAC